MSRDPDTGYNDEYDDRGGQPPLDEDEAVELVEDEEAAQEAALDAYWDARLEHRRCGDD